MTAPSSQEKRLCDMFDSFCKAVSRNFCRNLKRARENQEKHYTGEPVDHYFELDGYEDTYPSDVLVLYVDGYPCPFENDLLYQALSMLPEPQRKVLLLSFWCELTDKEIAKRMEVATRTVYNLRKRAFGAIKKYYEHNGHDP